VKKRLVKRNIKKIVKIESMSKYETIKNNIKGINRLIITT
jgi:hypothetical protein